MSMRIPRRRRALDEQHDPVEGANGGDGYLGVGGGGTKENEMTASTDRSRGEWGKKAQHSLKRVYGPER
jgi:hypothetical protein